jgi:transcriptional regulator with XRE-family HTH domain
MQDDARGWRLAEMRKRRGMTQEQVAVRMGVSVARVSQIERGDVSTQDVLNRFVSAFDRRTVSAFGPFSGVGRNGARDTRR